MASSEEKGHSNKFVREALDRLVESFKNEKNANKSASHLSHYRELPPTIKKTYELLHQGAEMVHGTSTKYTLVGKISIEDQKKLASDLLRGCEIIGAATHVLLQDGSGCSRAARHAAVRCSLSIFINVNHLVASFEDHTAMDENVGAQKTGAVWESCDTILKRLLPQGNRTAMRRELFTWTREIQDTMDEFQEMIDLGPGVSISGNAVEEEEDDFFGGDDQYSEAELPMAKACLALIKTSRGSMKITLETCEDLGEKAKESLDEKYLDSIAKSHECAREVGEGVTDLGSLMYPPLLPTLAELEAQMRKQSESIITLQDSILGLNRLPKKVSELAHTLRNAAKTRLKEFFDAVADAKL